MVFWKKEKKEEQKVLTERDIQEKLYGSFHRCSEPRTKEETAQSNVTVNVAPPQEMDLFQTEKDGQAARADRGTSSVATEAETGEKDNIPKTQDKLEETKSVLDVPSENDDLSRRARELELRFDEETKSIEEKPLDEYFPFSKRREGFNIKHLSSIWIKLDQIKEWLAGLPHKQLILVVGGIVGFLIIFNVVSNLAVRKDIEVAVPLVQNEGRDATKELTQEKQVKPQESATVQTPSDITPEKERTIFKSQQVPKAATPAVTSGAGRYTIQVCVYQNENDAKRLVSKLNGEKYVSFYDSFVTRRGQKFYRVFVGRFETFQEAKKAIQTYSTVPSLKSFEDSFIRSVESLS